MPYNIYTTFQPNNIVTINGNEVTAGIWSGDTGSLTAIYTSSQQVAISGEYYYDLYNGADPQESDIQFSVAYGHISGGSPPITQNFNSTLPTQAIYSQYRNVLLNSGISTFTFGSVSSQDIYVINFQRARMKQALDPGNWQLSLSGSRGIRTLIDDSGLATAVVGNLVAGNVYNIRSGSIEGGLNSADTTVYGLVFPDQGLILLSPSAISSSVGFSGFNSVAGGKTTYTGPFAPYTGSDITAYQYQHEGLVRSISGAMAAGKPFLARSAENITSRNYFVQLNPSEYNYSVNPTYYSGSTNVILEPFRRNGLAYVTTIGLYNSSNELLAVGKLSRPIAKSKDKLVTIRVRLDF